MSPITNYFGGEGKAVMDKMKKRYGKKGKKVFYATANKRGQNPKSGRSFPPAPARQA